MAKSEITKTLSERLEELTEGERDNNYKLSDKQQAEQMGIPYPTFTKYKNNTAECPISAIVKIAKYYNVSTDYLLGLAQVKTTNTGLKSICNYTGLTEKAIETICGISLSPDRIYSNALNLTLSSPEFSLLIWNIRRWLNELDLMEGAIDILKQKIRECREEPPKDIMKFAAEISSNLNSQSYVFREACDIIELQDKLNYREYNIQNQLKRLLDKLKEN